MSDLYPWIKAIHVAAALLFVGGLLASSMVLLSLKAAPERAIGFISVYARYERLITVPSMLIVWGLGLMLASSGAWFVHGWLQIKLIIVVLLSGLHGIQSGQMRNVEAGNDIARVRTLPIIVLGSIAIAILVIVKP
ncbi:Uncharacterized membrane protein [Tardiphaga sp. OK246]|uniref:CopD family protein n=1 Tax=Tardiphaga sp. OK246 TaxID=1855307 RepID=UPI000B6254A1|nr:CopD family protein [Tardiphaga sp. OK246]SNT32195.1 Uncharacterized membrane protein [Tardiphaga sp. OK246]